MNVMTTNKTTVESIAFASLSLSDLNPRTVVNEDSIVALAANISTVGLIQNLAGYRPDDGNVEIVAGGRRLRALALLQDDPRFQTVSINVTDDEAVARLWATSENSQREALNPADEIRDFGAMAKRGVAVPDIAVAYGVKEKHVYRRLALAHLPSPVLDALQANEISLSNAAAFTVSNDEKMALEVLETVRGEGYSDHQIKQMIKPDSVRGSDRRVIYVTEAGYDEAGGRKTADLFKEQTFFDDVALLDELFDAKLSEAVETLQTEGWKWIEAIHDSYLCHYNMGLEKFGRVYAEEGQLSEDEAGRYDALAELANGDVLDAAGEAELAALQAIIDGEYTDEQRAQAGLDG